MPVVVSVFYRFALASALLLPFMLLLNKEKVTNLKDHGFLILFGACLFCFNFICFYNATRYIPSGLVSVVFSLATIYNAVNGRIFYKEKISQKVVLATLIGFVGLSLLFWTEVQGKADTKKLFLGVGLAALGTLFFSFGNMISRRNSQAKIKPTLASAWGMFYGSIILIIIIVLTNTEIVIPSTQQYYLALVYLSVFGSIVAFTTYLTLIDRIGANRAAYATVIFPIIALILSSIFEGYLWTWTSYIGLVFTLGGIVLINYKPTSKKEE